MLGKSELDKPLLVFFTEAASYLLYISFSDAINCVYLEMTPVSYAVLLGHQTQRGTCVRATGPYLARRGYFGDN